VRCPSDGRGLEVDVEDRGAHGTLRVLLSPRGGGMSVISRGGGSVITSSVSTRSGGTLSISLTSQAGRAPLGKQVNQLTRALAAQN
jgi:hypothetical protein